MVSLTIHHQNSHWESASYEWAVRTPHQGATWTRLLLIIIIIIPPNPSNRLTRELESLPPRPPYHCMDTLCENDEEALYMDVSNIQRLQPPPLTLHGMNCLRSPTLPDPPAVGVLVLRLIVPPGHCRRRKLTRSENPFQDTRVSS